MVKRYESKRKSRMNSTVLENETTQKGKTLPEWNDRIDYNLTIDKIPKRKLPKVTKLNRKIDISQSI